MSIFQRNRGTRIPYDPALRQPAVRRSICTGEMTAGFIDTASGKFHELQLLRGQKELEDFCRDTGVTPEELRTIY